MHLISILLLYVQCLCIKYYRKKKKINKKFKKNNNNNNNNKALGSDAVSGISPT